MSSREFQAKYQGKSSLISSPETTKVETVKGGVEGVGGASAQRMGCLVVSRESCRVTLVSSEQCLVPY